MKRNQISFEARLIEREEWEVGSGKEGRREDEEACLYGINARNEEDDATI